MESQKSLLWLVVDDDPDESELVEAALGEIKSVCDSSIKLRTLGDGMELLEYLSLPDSQRPDLILLDLNMPRMDGKEALKELKSGIDFRGIPVIVFTTSNEPAIISECCRLGASDFLTKPAGFSELLNVVGNLVGNWACSTQGIPLTCKAA